MFVAPFKKQSSALQNESLTVNFATYFLYQYVSVNAVNPYYFGDFFIHIYFFQLYNLLP